MARGRGLRGRFGGGARAAAAERPLPEWVDAQTVPANLSWEVDRPIDEALVRDFAIIRNTALPNAWLPFTQNMAVVEEGVAGDMPYDPNGLALEMDSQRGRITVGSWLRLGKHCAERAPMPCTIEEWAAAREADKEFAKPGLRKQVRMITRMRELGIDPEVLKSDPQVGERLNAIVHGGVNPIEQSAERDYLGDCMCLAAERAGYPVLEVRGDMMRSVTDHGGCRISRLSANDKTYLQLIFLLMEVPVSKEGGVLWLSDSNPNRAALLDRIWPARDAHPVIRPF